MVPSGWSYWTLFFPELMFQVQNHPEMVVLFFFDFFSGNY